MHPSPHPCRAPSRRLTWWRGSMTTAGRSSSAYAPTDVTGGEGVPSLENCVTFGSCAAADAVRVMEDTQKSGAGPWLMHQAGRAVLRQAFAPLSPCPPAELVWPTLKISLSSAAAWPACLVPCTLPLSHCRIDESLLLVGCIGGGVHAGARLRSHPALGESSAQRPQARQRNREGGKAHRPQPHGGTLLARGSRDLPRTRTPKGGMAPWGVHKSRKRDSWTHRHAPQTPPVGESRPPEVRHVLQGRDPDPTRRNAAARGDLEGPGSPKGGMAPSGVHESRKRDSWTHRNAPQKPPLGEPRPPEVQHV
jgi:hypothetical protein